MPTRNHFRIDLPLDEFEQFCADALPLSGRRHVRMAYERDVLHTLPRHHAE